MAIRSPGGGGGNLGTPLKPTAESSSGNFSRGRGQSVEKCVVSVRMPRRLLEEMDKLMDEGIFKARSEIVKEALEELLEELGVERILSEVEEIDIPTIKGR